MAELLDLETDTTSELEPAPADTTDAVVEDTTAPAASTAPEDDLPPQFRGKSLAEVAKYAAATEKSLSRQGQELGEIRKLADELIKSQLVKKPEPEAPKEVDFFENPQEAIRNAVGNDPRLKAIEQQNIAFQQAQARQVLAQKHPDFGNVVQDPEFADWIKGSKVRTRLFQEAENFDVDAADELLSTYKQLKTVKVAQQAQETAKVDTKARDAALKTVAVDTSGSGETTRKVYRRADLIRLKMRDPARYESMGDEIMAAYAQGRVR